MTCTFRSDDFATFTDLAIKFWSGTNTTVGEINADRGGRL